MVVCVVLMILSIPVCLLESHRRHIASMSEGAAITASSREQQRINRSLGAPPHRPRHPCRTPSQVSTASLPVYKNEPGDQELVVSQVPTARTWIQSTTTPMQMILTLPRRRARTPTSPAFRPTRPCFWAMPQPPTRGETPQRTLRSSSTTA
ncbi:hypothetical protein C8J57DRAFT_274491 [Mycena rebaudengoi]|nr:hypothetical protein C8J57DRAFT_274491 [Mycena rebaudengoi]